MDFFKQQHSRLWDTFCFLFLTFAKIIIKQAYILYTPFESYGHVIFPNIFHFLISVEEKEILHFSDVAFFVEKKFILGCGTLQKINCKLQISLDKCKDSHQLLKIFPYFAQFFMIGGTILRAHNRQSGPVRGFSALWCNCRHWRLL